jgi:aspartyl aminopeptidase
MVERLAAAGFERLAERDSWDLRPGGRYLVTRNGSSLVAFVIGHGDPASGGLRLVGAHTDSPGLRLKPRPEVRRHGYLQLGVEVYGGALLNPWFDRDLSIAGRVSYVEGDERLRHALIDFEDPVAVIPSLAIHLDREVNDHRTINAQKDLPPVVMRAPAGGEPVFHDIVLRRLRVTHPGAARVLDFELSLYDCQPPALAGLEREFLTGARLDNLLSCYAGMESIAGASGARHCVLVCNDHEEVGSLSAPGAQGPFLRSVLRRIAGSAETLDRAMAASMLVSADNAHGIHPNFADRHDEQHGPVLNAGPVIKINASQRYASTSETAALFRQLCEHADVPVQSFVNRADLACGSTIGPITSAEIGVRTLDVGVASFAMHSIREMTGARDPEYLFRALSAFYALEDLPEPPR